MAGSPFIRRRRGEDLLQLSVREPHALNDTDRFPPDEFSGTRKGLLARSNEVLIAIKNWRKAWQKENPAERARHPEVKALLEVLQQMIAKILQLDQEDQPARLRRGLLRVQNVPSFAPQPASFVSKVYARHTS